MSLVPLAPLKTRSLPALARCYPRSFTFYVTRPTRSIPAFVPNFRPQQKATKKTKIPNRDNSDLRSLRYLLFIRCSELRLSLSVLCPPSSDFPLSLITFSTKVALVEFRHFLQDQKAAASGQFPTFYFSLSNFFVR